MPVDDAPAAADPRRARREILGGLLQGAAIAAVVLAALYPWLGSRLLGQRGPAPVQTALVTPPAPPPPSAIARRLDLGGMDAPADVTQVASWAVAAADNGDSPFAIVDKRRARVYVFEASGRLLGNSPVLLGYAAGDDTVPGIGEKALADIKPSERTTPAGRFESEPGRNANGEDVVWVDYDAAVSMHRVRATNPKERRLERLATPTAADNRISWGCINVPVAFFDSTVWPQLGGRHAVVYVLPERKSLTAYFPGAGLALASRSVAAGGNSAKP